MSIDINKDAVLSLGGGDSGDYIPKSQKSQPNGVATLDENGTVPLSQLPDTGGDITDYIAMNVASGAKPSQFSTDNSIAIGRDATTSAYSVVIGNQSRVSTAGRANCVIVGNLSTSYGSDSVLIGRNVVIQGQDSVSIGNSSTTTHNQGIAIGLTAQARNVGTIAIGRNSNINSYFGVAIGANTSSTFDNTVLLGSGTSVTGVNQVQLGNSSTTTYAYGAVQDRSDIRDKADVQNTDLGLDFINALRPVKYKWDYREDYAKDLFPILNKEDFETDAEYQAKLEQQHQDRCAFFQNPVKDGSKIRSRYHQGLIADEVQQVMNDLNVDFGGYQDHSINGGMCVKSIGYIELIAPLIKAVQELSAEVQELSAEVQELKNQRN